MGPRKQIRKVRKQGQRANRHLIKFLQRLEDSVMDGLNISDKVRGVVRDCEEIIAQMNRVIAPAESGPTGATIKFSPESTTAVADALRKHDEMADIVQSNPDPELS